MCYCSSMPQIDMERNREGVTRRNNITSLIVRPVSTAANGLMKITIMIIIIIEIQIIIQNVDQKKEKKLYNDSKYVTN